MILENKSLKSHNTFGLKARAKSYINLQSESELIKLIKDGNIAGKEILVLGGGSNILFAGDFEGLVLHPEMNNIKVSDSDYKYVYLECGAGVDWDYFVDYCVENSYGGLENLSYIPGNVGAAPIQNIGAYGVEVKETIKSVRAVDLENGDIRTFTNTECDFAYRSSIFKKNLKGMFLITSVLFKLEKDPEEYNISYGALKSRVEQRGAVNLNNIREAVIEIRKEKLPEPEQLGNAGSFFKNPVIKPGLYNDIKSHFNELPSYPAESNDIKVPAGWLIEKCGWKGYRKGDAGVHKNQALVLVNYGSATGMEILKLSEEIIKSVNDKFGIVLEREVNVV